MKHIIKNMEVCKSTSPNAAIYHTQCDLTIPIPKSGPQARGEDITWTTEEATCEACIAWINLTLLQRLATG